MTTEIRFFALKSKKEIEVRTVFNVKTTTTLADRCSFFCVSGQRGTIAKSMHEEHLCVVALTSRVRGTQFFPLASYRLV